MNPDGTHECQDVMSRLECDPRGMNCDQICPAPRSARFTEQTSTNPPKVFFQRTDVDLIQMYEDAANDNGADNDS